jgi:hypothetical protein
MCLRGDADENDIFILHKPCDETSDLFICVNNEYVYISEERAVFVANEILKYYEDLKKDTCLF